MKFLYFSPKLAFLKIEIQESLRFDHKLNVEDNFQENEKTLVNIISSNEHHHGTFVLVNFLKLLEIFLR